MASRATSTASAAAAAAVPGGRKGRLGKIGKLVADVFTKGSSSAQRRLVACRAAVKAIASLSECGVPSGATVSEADVVNSLKLALSSAQLLTLLGESDDDLRSACGQLIGILGASSRATYPVYTAWLDKFVNGIDFESEDTDLYIVLTVLETAKAFVGHSTRIIADADSNDERAAQPGGASSISHGEDDTIASTSVKPTSVASIARAQLPLSTSCVVYRACCLVIEELGEGYLLSPVLELGTQLCLELHVVSETGATHGLNMIENASPPNAVKNVRDRDLLPDTDGHAFLDLVDLLIGRYLSVGSDLDEVEDDHGEELLEAEELLFLQSLERLQILWAHFRAVTSPLLVQMTKDLEALCGSAPPTHHVNSSHPQNDARRKGLRFCTLISRLGDAIAVETDVDTTVDAPNASLFPKDAESPTTIRLDSSACQEMARVLFGPAMDFIAKKPFQALGRVATDRILPRFVAELSTFCHNYRLRWKRPAAAFLTQLVDLVCWALHNNTHVETVKMLCELAATETLARHAMWMDASCVKNIVRAAVLALSALQSSDNGLVKHFIRQLWSNSLSMRKLFCTAVDGVVSTIAERIKVTLHCASRSNAGGPNGLWRSLSSNSVIMHSLSAVEVMASLPYDAASPAQPKVSQGTSDGSPHDPDPISYLFVQVAQLLHNTHKQCGGPAADQPPPFLICAMGALAKLAQVRIGQGDGMQVAPGNLCADAAVTAILLLQGMFLELLRAVQHTVSRPLVLVTLLVAQRLLTIASTSTFISTQQTWTQLFDSLVAAVNVVSQCISSGANGSRNARSNSVNGHLRDAALGFIEAGLCFANAVAHRGAFVDAGERMAELVSRLIHIIQIDYASRGLTSISPATRRIVSLLSMFPVAATAPSFTPSLLQTQCDANVRPCDPGRASANTGEQLKFLLEVIAGRKSMDAFSSLHALGWRQVACQKNAAHAGVTRSHNAAADGFFDSSFRVLAENVVACFGSKFKTFAGSAPDTCKEITSIAAGLVAEAASRRHPTKEVPSDRGAVGCIPFALRVRLFLFFLHCIEKGLDFACSLDTRPGQFGAFWRLPQHAADLGLQKSLEQVLNTSTRSWYHRNRRVFDDWIGGSLRPKAVIMAAACESEADTVHHVWKQLNSIGSAIVAASDQALRLTGWESKEPPAVNAATLPTNTTENALRSCDAKLSRAVFAAERCLSAAFAAVVPEGNIDAIVGMRAWFMRVVVRRGIQRGGSCLSQALLALRDMAPQFLKPVDNEGNTAASTQPPMAGEGVSLLTPTQPSLLVPCLLDALESDARGEYEAALQGYEQALSDSDTVRIACARLDSDAPIQLIVDRSLQCLVSLRDWRATLHWIKTIHGLRQLLLKQPHNAEVDGSLEQSPSGAAALVPPVRVQLLQGLAQFDNGQLEACRKTIAALPAFSSATDATVQQHRWRCQQLLLKCMLTSASLTDAERSYSSSTERQTRNALLNQMAPLLLSVGEQKSIHIVQSVGDLKCALRPGCNGVAARISDLELVEDFNDGGSTHFGSLHQIVATGNIHDERGSMFGNESSFSGGRMLRFHVFSAACRLRNLRLAHRLLHKDQLRYGTQDFIWRYQTAMLYDTRGSPHAAVSFLRDLSVHLLSKLEQDSVSVDDFTRPRSVSKDHELGFLQQLTAFVLRRHFVILQGLSQLDCTDDVSVQPSQPDGVPDTSAENWYPMTLASLKRLGFSATDGPCNVVDRDVSPRLHEALWSIWAARSLGQRSSLAFEYASFLYQIGCQGGQEIVSEGSRSTKLMALKTALEQYFVFLEMEQPPRLETASMSNNASRLAASGGLWDKSRSCDRDSRVVCATLRILKLLVKLPEGEIQHVFGTFAVSTPISKWEPILPQLCSRLRHPNTFVSAQVRKLLLRIAHENPYRLLPTLIADGSDTEQPPSRSDKAPDVDDAAGYSLREHKSLGLGFVKAEMRKRYGTMVASAEKLFGELAKSAVLWEDRWLRLLQKVLPDFQTRLQRFRKERKRVLGLASSPVGRLVPPLQNPTSHHHVVGEKFVTLMRPLAHALTKLSSETFGSSVVGLTAHERKFAKQFFSRFATLREFFQTPHHSVDRDVVTDTLKVLVEDVKQFGKQARAIRVRDLSPWLAQDSAFVGDLQLCACPIPGKFRKDKHTAPITIMRMGEWCEVLRSKTRPKKLVFLGSDGQEHSYLLKGHDDLHLDERIMQLLRIVNTFLSSTSTARSRGLKALNYDVIPVAAKCGLIQWVAGTTSLFQLFTNHCDYLRHRRAQLESLEAKRADGAPKVSKGTDVDPLITHPARLFYHFLKPALRKKGLESSTGADREKSALSRNDWPISVLRTVFARLSKEAPAHEVLPRAFWLLSSSSSQWWQRVTMYSRSLGVSSIVGFMIGLGDRHLENILLTSDTCELLHIDYNVCFEKGQSLRVPERVPFRLTRLLRAGLGVCGIDGAFRIACEQTLHVLRDKQETLTTLLEAFVYDPLVDWSAHREEDIERADQELDVSLDLFMSRIGEEIGRTEVARCNAALVSTMRDLHNSCTSAKSTWQRWQHVHVGIEEAEHRAQSCLKNVAAATVELQNLKQQASRAEAEAKTTGVARSAAEALLKSEISDLHSWAQDFCHAAEALPRFSRFDKHCPSVVKAAPLWDQGSFESNLEGSAANAERPLGSVCRAIIGREAPLGRGTKRKLKDLLRMESKLELSREKLHNDAVVAQRRLHAVLQTVIVPSLERTIGLRLDPWQPHPISVFPTHTSFGAVVTAESIDCTVAGQFLKRLNGCRPQLSQKLSMHSLATEDLDLSQVASLRHTSSVRNAVLHCTRLTRDAFEAAALSVAKLNVVSSIVSELGEVASQATRLLLSRAFTPKDAAGRANDRSTAHAEQDKIIEATIGIVDELQYLHWQAVGQSSWPFGSVACCKDVLAVDVDSSEDDVDDSIDEYDDFGGDGDQHESWGIGVFGIEGERQHEPEEALVARCSYSFVSATAVAAVFRVLCTVDSHSAAAQLEKVRCSLREAVALLFAYVRGELFTPVDLVGLGDVWDSLHEEQRKAQKLAETARSDCQDRPQCWRTVLQQCSSSRQALRSSFAVLRSSSFPNLQSFAQCFETCLESAALFEAHVVESYNEDGDQIASLFDLHSDVLDSLSTTMRIAIDAACRFPKICLLRSTLLPELIQVLFAGLCAPYLRWQKQQTQPPMASTKDWRNLSYEDMEKHLTVEAPATLGVLIPCLEDVMLCDVPQFAHRIRSYAQAYAAHFLNAEHQVQGTTMDDSFKKDICSGATKSDFDQLRQEVATIAQLQDQLSSFNTNCDTLEKVSLGEFSNLDDDDLASVETTRRAIVERFRNWAAECIQVLERARRFGNALAIADDLQLTRYAHCTRSRSEGAVPDTPAVLADKRLTSAIAGFCSSAEKHVQRERALAALNASTHKAAEEVRDATEQHKTTQDVVQELRVQEQALGHVLVACISGVPSLRERFLTALSSYTPILESTAALLESFARLKVTYIDTDIGRRARLLKKSVDSLAKQASSLGRGLQLLRDSVLNILVEPVDASAPGNESLLTLQVMADNAPMCSEILSMHEFIHAGLECIATGTTVADLGGDEPDDEVAGDVEDEGTEQLRTADGEPSGMTSAREVSALDSGFEEDMRQSTQTRNEYAVRVLRRVEKKLSGQRNASDSAPWAISDQVTRLVSEATDIDRLCRMYEGWSAWI